MSSSYDRRFGLVATEAEPGGYEIAYGFDDFGRLVSIARPTGERTFIERRRIEDVQRHRFYERIDTQTLKGPKGSVILDHRKNQRLLLHAGMSGELYATTIHLNRDLKPTYISRPYSIGATESPGTLIAYDALGRETRRTNPVGHLSRTRYQGLTIHKEDARGHVTTYETNHRGQVIDVRDPPLGDTSIRGRTQYFYGPFGFLSEVRRELQLNTRLITDAYGRLRFHNDTDTGFSQYRYNGFDELVELIDDNGDTIHWTYDEFGRVISRQDKDGEYSCTYDTTFPRISW